MAFAQKQKLVSEDGSTFLGAVKAKRKTRSGSVARSTDGGSAEKKPKEHTPVEVHKILPPMLLLTWPAAAKVLGGGIAGTLARLHEKNEEVDQEALDVETEVEKAVSEAERKRVMKLSLIHI